MKSKLSKSPPTGLKSHLAIIIAVHDSVHYSPGPSALLNPVVTSTQHLTIVIIDTNHSYFYTIAICLSQPLLHNHFFNLFVHESMVVVHACVCPLSHISPLERLFFLKILSCTQRATEVKKFVGFSLKPLRSKVMASFTYP